MTARIIPGGGDAGGDGRPPAWLADAVIYEIFPQSFNDADGDGVGDFRGIMEKLDYLQWLGVDAIWLNPCFASPFRDAGYDVADYFSMAPRYGGDDAFDDLIAAARSRGIRVLLDLVAGHTSIAHPWFQHSMMEPDDHRYIWSDRPSDGFVPSPGPRSGWYLKNFFPEQPALNYGYARPRADEPWRQRPDDEWPRRNREMLKQVIGHWLDRGVAGFRVDMAFSLVKDDPGLVETTALWHEISGWVHDRYPASVLIPESDENRTLTAGASGGFDADFALVIQQEHSALFNNGATGILPWQTQVEPCYFDPEGDSVSGGRALGIFLHQWEERLRATGPDRLIVLPSSDHDFSRLVVGSRTADQCAPAFTFLLTWRSVPSIYYGDEIGMRNLAGASEKEGSRWNPGYNRAGCRTPMQWDDALPNCGFSTASPDRLYLAQDPWVGRPTVAAQVAGPTSLLNHIRRLIELRRSIPELGTHSTVKVLNAGYPLVYQRGESYLIVVNPAGHQVAVDLPQLRVKSLRLLLGDGVGNDGERLIADRFGSAVFSLADHESVSDSPPGID